MDTVDTTVDDLIATLQPALDRAGKLGLLIGGQLHICKWDEPGGKFKRVKSLTIIHDDQSPARVMQPPAPPELPNLVGNVAPNAVTLTGQICFKCGSDRMQRAGTCEVCLDCGESGGCG